MLSLDGLGYYSAVPFVSGQKDVCVITLCGDGEMLCVDTTPLCDWGPFHPLSSGGARMYYLLHYHIGHRRVEALCVSVRHTKNANVT